MQNLLFFTQHSFEIMGSWLLLQPFSDCHSISLLCGSLYILGCLCFLCSKENFDSIPDLEFNPIRAKIVHAFFDKR